MRKRICSLCLALALLSQTALAAEVTLFGEVAVPPEIALMAVSEPVVSVRVPAEGWVIVNPYGIEVERDDVVSQEEIVSSILTFENRGATPIQVDARAVGTTSPQSGVRFVETPPAPDAADKELFLYAEFQPSSGAGVSWMGTFLNAPNQLMVTSDERTKSGVLELGPAGSPDSLGAMHVSGSLATRPEQPWTPADDFKVNIIFTFTAPEDERPVSIMLPEERLPDPPPAPAEDEWEKPDFDARLPETDTSSGDLFKPVRPVWPEAPETADPEPETPETADPESANPEPETPETTDPVEPEGSEAPGGSEEPEGETEPAADPTVTDE